MKEKTASTVDAEEIERFSRIASEWWNPEGKFKPLHRINPLRIGYIRDHACRHFNKNTENPAPLEGLSLLDIGCGGGLMAEPMCRLGTSVTAIDASEKNIKVASTHAQQGGLSIDYRATTAEALLETGVRFDIVLALEIIEHVADVEAFLSAACGLLKPGGLLVCSTLNRTLKSYALAIVGAEYVLRWLPVGTHQWKKFLRPSEICRPMRQNGVETIDMQGMVMNPLNWQWRWDEKDLSVNYIVVGKKAA
jgi:2-polyprenyl-6-hydroxyphenyl methylase/3-demethylubiquinone-9 3-methyltransferase